MKKKYYLLFLSIPCLLLALSLLFRYKDQTASVLSSSVLSPKYVVVVDAGHGGADPGKVGINNALEKDINLSIALKLKMLLESQDVRVVLTRSGDDALCDTSKPNLKIQDMKNRLQVIENAKPDLVVSIHQNSFPDETVQGAQTFYYHDSVASRALAETIQQSLILCTRQEKERKAEPNSSYYLLKKPIYPVAIVECGFLSHPEEAKKLLQDSYQESMAWAIHLGVLQYLNHNQ